MADNVNLETSISVDTSKGQNDVKNLATQFANMADAMRAIQTAAQAAARGFDKLERGAANTKTSTKAAKKQVDDLAQSYRNLNNAAKNSVDYQRVQAKPATAKAVDPSIGKLANKDQINAQKAVQEAIARLDKIRADEIEKQNQALAAQAKLEQDVKNALREELQIRTNLRKTGNGEGISTPSTAAEAAKFFQEQGLIGKELDEQIVTRQKLLAIQQGERALAEQEAKRVAEVNAQFKQRLDNLQKEYEYQQQLAGYRQQQRADAVTRTVASGKNNFTGISVKGVGDAVAITDQNKALGKSLQQAQLAADHASAAIGDYRDRLANTRYALYDVSNSLGIAAAAILAFNVGTVKAAADYQTAFAQIQRTSQATSGELLSLQADFLSLAQNIPVSFDKLAQIGTLAGQLGVETKNIAAFTETTAQFSATTNVTAEAAATAFGRLSTLLPDVGNNYKALGSSILNVGVNSVATESQIIETTTQIAAAGVQAGFTGSQIVGLAASFASLGVAPEQARGVVTRVFYDIGTAVAEGGDSLDNFAKISGMSAEDFKAAWGKDAGATFTEFLKGLKKEGSGAQATINDLGITAVRDANSLLRLSQNVDEVSKNLKNAKEGFTDTSILSKSFATQAATLASKFQELVNTLQGFFAVIGSSGLPVLTTFVEALKGVVVGLTTIAASPVGQALGLVVGVFTAVNGLALLLGSGLARVVAGFLAFNPAIALAKSSFTSFNKEVIVTQRAAAAAGVQMTTLQARLATVGIAAKTAGVALKGALASTGIGLAIVGVTTVIEALVTEFQSAEDRAKSMFGALDGLTTALSEDKGLATATQLQVQLGNATDSSTGKIKTQTIAWGENSKAALASQLASTDAFKKIAEGAYDNIDGFNKEDYVAAILGDPVKGGQEYVAKLQSTLDEKLSKVRNTRVGPDIARDAAGIGELKKQTDAVTAVVKESATALKAQKLANKAAGIEANNTAAALDDEGSAAQTLDDKVKAAFATITGQTDLSSAIDTLTTGIYNAGNSFSYLNQTGVQNLTNLQTAIVAIIASGEQMGISATDAVSALFINLQKQGVDTANLLAQIAPSLGKLGVNTEALSGKTASSGLIAEAYAAQLSDVSDNAIKAASAQKKNGAAAKESGKEMRTAADYASDLSGVFQRAFDIKYGVQEAKDAIQQQLNDMKEARSEAQKALDKDNKDLIKANAAYGRAYADTFADAFGTELTSRLSDAFDGLFKRQQGLDAIQTQFYSLQNTIDQARKDLDALAASLLKLQSQKGIKTIQLGTALNYGDTTRATDLQADLADLDVQIAENATKAAEAQAKLSRETTGTSAAAIQNRSDLLGLVDGYQSYIEALQATGAGADEINGAIADSKKNFTAQGKALGFSDEQLSSFVSVFDQYKNANYAASVAANTAALEAQEEALQAVRDLEADVKVQQDLLSTSTEGNSNAAIRNRQAVRDLNGAFGDYAGALAAAGYNQDQIKGKLNDFANVTLPAQGKAAGLTKGQINDLKDSIDGMKLAVDKVPRNLTVQIDLNKTPAENALIEFQRKLAEQKDKKYSGGTIEGPTFNDNINSAAARKAAVVALLNKAIVSLQNSRTDASDLFYSREVQKYTKQLKTGDYYTGGFTGQGGKYDPAGTVHKGEFVIPKQYVDQSKGIPNAQAMNWIGNQGSTAGSGISQVELSPTDRALLAAAGNVTVTVDGKVIAQASNANNLNSAMRGSN
jgi:TP901 family phage tail tape measure protein